LVQTQNTNWLYAKQWDILCQDSFLFSLF
jgi:hypothetical protein